MVQSTSVEPINVLVVEDNEDDLFFIKKALSDVRYHLTAIMDGEEAFLYLQNPTIAPDIVLLDNQLPGMNGLEIIENLRNENHDYSYIFLTVDNTIDTVLKAMKAGALDFIIKSMELKKELPEKVEKVYKIHANIKERKKAESKLLLLNEELLVQYQMKEKHTKELIKAKEHTEESEQKFRAIFNNSTNAIGVSKNGIGVFFNPAYLKLFGCNSAEEIEGKKITEQIAVGERERILKYVKDRKAGKEVPSNYESIGLRRNGEEFDMEISVSNYKLAKETFSLVIIRDITERKHHEDEILKYQNHLEDMVRERTLDIEEAINKLQHAQSRLVQSEKMASLGILTAGVAHEINNPLNFILGGYAGLEKYFTENNIKNDQVTILLNNIKTGINRATGIVNGLNQFSRGKESFDEECDIHSTIDNCLLMLNTLKNKKIEIIKHYSPNTLNCIGNVGKLHQIFINILTNSIQAIDADGLITISTSKKQNSVLIEFSDSGCGIQNENIPKILDPFFTTKDPGKGVGLGLSITYNLISEHKGKIEIESKVNQGTLVKVTLPIK